jgi:hypothetical protein
LIKPKVAPIFPAASTPSDYEASLSAAVSATFDVVFTLQGLPSQTHVDKVVEAFTQTNGNTLGYILTGLFVVNNGSASIPTFFYKVKTTVISESSMPFKPQAATPSNR